MVSAPSEIALPAGRLRRFLPQDIDAFAALNADPVVMEFFPHPWSFEESEAAFKQVQEGFSERGFGVYALESKGEFSGIVGLSVPSFKAYFTPCVEILWRLDPGFWGKGLVTVAAREVLNIAFRELNLPEVVAFTVVKNQRSVRVMERLGMERNTEPFSLITQRSQMIGCDGTFSIRQHIRPIWTSPAKTRLRGWPSQAEPDRPGDGVGDANATSRYRPA